MNGYQVISPACLAKDGKLADLDFILVGTFGVLCVKCVGRGGSIYGSAGDAMWLQVKNQDRISFANPILEAERDTRLVRDILFSAKLKNIPVETVCVFTNPVASLALPRSTGHYTVKEFRSLLGQSRFLQERKIDLDAVCTAARLRHRKEIMCCGLPPLREGLFAAAKQNSLPQSGRLFFLPATSSKASSPAPHTGHGTGGWSPSNSWPQMVQSHFSWGRISFLFS